MKINNVTPEVVERLARRIFEPIYYCGLYGEEHPCYAQFYHGLCNDADPTVDGYCDYMVPIKKEG